MTAPWDRVTSLFYAVRMLDTDARSSFLALACRGDDGLRAEVEALLVGDSESAGFLEDAPWARLASTSDAADLKDQIQRDLSGAYTIERELGGGGMSRVFLAEDAQLKRKVVVKVLPEEMSHGVSSERFRREIALAAALQHPNIVPVLSAGVVGGLPYYTMPYIDGESLRHRLATGDALPIGEVTPILREIARALAYAHGRGVVHRDIKPENILMAAGAPVVTDFGIAKALVASGSMTSAGLTATGISVGTPSYMAPEQIAADPGIDHRADIYAFGVLAYELLVGRTPFFDRTPRELATAHLTERPKSVSDLRADVPVEMANLVARCLEKDPTARPASADEILNVLDRDLAPRKARGTVFTVAAGTRAAVAVALAVMLCGVAVTIWRQTSRTGSAAKSLAVLPFEYLGASKENEFFSEGITIEITHALTMVPGLSVAPNTVVRADTAKGLDLRRAGRELGVRWLLQGTIQRSGDRVRINATLVDAATLRNMWSGQYDNDFKDIFAVQDTIARGIAGELRVKLAGGSSTPVVRAATANAEAHSLYLQGLYLWNRRTGAMIRQAISFFEQAIAKDPRYAQAYAGVGMGYVVMPTYADVNEAEMFAKAEDAARRALAIDSTSVEAQSVIGFAEFSRYRNAAGERAFSKAIELDSSFATVHQWRELQLGRLARFDEAIAEGKRARSLDPQSLAIRTSYATTLYQWRRLAEAESTVRKLIVFDPAYVNAWRTLAEVLLAEKRYDEAIAAAQRAVTLSGVSRSAIVSTLARGYALSGQPAKARELLQQLLVRAQREPVSAAAIAVLYDVLGDREHALQWLARGVADYDALLVGYGRGPMFDHLRADPRGAALFAKMETVSD